MPLLRLGALPERLDTARLFLRPYREADAQWYFAMGQRNLAHLERHESGNTVFGMHCEDDAASVLRTFGRYWRERTAFALGVFVQGTEEFAGQLYLGVTHAELPALNLGFFTDCAHVNQGYMTEAAHRGLAFAFGELGARRVGLWCDDTNVPSRRIAERCGFRLEGHVREDKRHADGSITGSLCYGLLRGEFEARPNRGP